jgi:hypothetical protein
MVASETALVDVANSYYSSPQLIIKEMHELYLYECVNSVVEPISIRAFLDIFTKAFNFYFGAMKSSHM